MKMFTNPDMERIYERLRKRSYRRTGTWVDGRWYMIADHESYLDGLRDALRAIEAEARERDTSLVLR